MLFLSKKCCKFILNNYTKMKRKLVLLLSLVVSSLLFSQNTLEINSANHVKLNGVRLTVDQVRNTLSSNPEILKSYNKGATLNTVGTTCLGLGIGLILGNGIANINNANNGKDTDGRPGIFILGGVLAVTGTVMKITGNGKRKKSLKQYNETQTTQKEVSLINNSHGLGIAFRF